jgi:hypothetical protein
METREQTSMPPEHHRTCAGSPTLPHQEGDDAGAGRGRRGGWRTVDERRHLVPWAQEAPGPRHGAAVAGRSVRPMQDVHAFGPQLRDIASELLLNGVKEDDARLLAALEPSTASWIDSEAALGLDEVVSA